MNSVRNYMSILLFCCTIVTSAQQYIFEGELGKFSNAASFSINPAGILYISDSDENEITKLDTLGNVLKFIGGYGWQESLFDDPCDIFANTLNVYVADKNNDRVQIFDKDLNFLSQIKNSNNSSGDEFRYPSGIGISNQGDLFILDSDNSRILKYNILGKFQFQIGGVDAGRFALSNPKNIAVTFDQKILVIDNDNLVAFDHFGNGILKFNLKFEALNINATFQNVTLTDGKTIFISNPADVYNFKKFEPKIEIEIKDAAIFNQKLYVLTPENILIYKIVM